MIIIMKPQATEEQIGSLCQDLSRQGMQVQRNAGVDCTVLGVLGGVTRLVAGYAYCGNGAAVINAVRQANDL